MFGIKAMRLESFLKDQMITRLTLERDGLANEIRVLNSVIEAQRVLRSEAAKRGWNARRSIK